MCLCVWGDPSLTSPLTPNPLSGFACALDLVKFIRSEYGSEFGISVAGYPEGHPNAIVELKDGDSAITATERLRVSEAPDKNGTLRRYVCRDEAYAAEIAYLKEKVDAGADFVITQMFFDTDVFVQFCKDCVTAGITAPIVPGVMCINNYGGFFRMTGFCKTRVPTNLKEDMEKVRRMCEEREEQRSDEPRELAWIDGAPLKVAQYSQRSSRPPVVNSDAISNADTKSACRS